MPLISDVVREREVYWISGQDTVREAARYLCERHTGAAAVVEGNDVAGVFSERDVLVRVVLAGCDPDTTLVRDVMSPAQYFIRLDDTVALAKASMLQNRVRHLIVIGRSGSLRGLVSMRELMQADSEDAHAMISRLNDAYYEQAYQVKAHVAANRVVVEGHVAGR